MAKHQAMAADNLHDEEADDENNGYKSWQKPIATKPTIAGHSSLGGRNPQSDKATRYR